MSKNPETIMIVIMQVAFHLSDPPCDKLTSNNKNPALNRNAPIQSTPEARTVASSALLGGSFGTTNIAITAIVKEAPATTKKTISRLAH